MTVHREVRCVEDYFDRPQALTTTPGVGGWTVKDTSSSGTPTYLATKDGMKLTLAATGEEECVTMYHNDVLTYDLAKLQHIEFIASVAGVDSATVVSIGVGSAQANDEDTIAVNAFFKIEGATSTSALVVESDDGTTDNNDKATGKSLASTPIKMLIDFTNGLTDVRFYANGDRVAADTTFDMSGISSGQGVQPFVQVYKASGTGVPSVTVRKFRAQYQFVAGA